ncbi:MAG TPA: hypothetical protein VL084_12970 [Thermoanaerobaculia bacterium]|nr:hypothetical protein [Thermoanaerobaculia bacterium]
MKSVPVLLLVLTAAGAARVASAQQAPTPIPERVTVPSLPDQQNKEGVVKPSGSLATDPAGYVQNNPTAVDPQAAPPAPPGGTASSQAPVGPGLAGRSTAPAPGQGPTGKAVVAAAHLSRRGVVKAFEKGVSVTIVEASGRERTVPLAATAEVYDGLKVGDSVVLRIPLGKPADGKSADRVQKQGTTQAPPPSKFSKAQTPSG